MVRKARPVTERDPFSEARDTFAGMIEMLRRTETATHAETERDVLTHGTELLRQLLQARFELLFSRVLDVYDHAI